MAPTKQEYDRVSLHVHQQMTAYIDVSMCCTCGVLVLDEKVHNEWNHGQRLDGWSAPSQELIR